jgi:hypothetical protein
MSSALASFATAVTAHFKLRLAKLGALGALLASWRLPSTLQVRPALPGKAAALGASRLTAYRDRL